MSRIITDIRTETPGPSLRPDLNRQIESLCDAVFGPGWRSRTAQRLRETNRVWADVSQVAVDVSGQVVATARVWPVRVGRFRGVILLGPVAVAAHARGKGLGLRLADLALKAATDNGTRWAVLVGDLSRFGQIGFVRASDALCLPGPVDRKRLLVRALRGQKGALTGMVSVPRDARQASSAPQP